jgi:hypothetical protein
MKAHSQRGAVAILVALLLPALLGLMALAIDVGYVLARRNHMQVAADSAALLAASARQHGEDIGTATAMAHIGTTANGFQNNINSTLVTVNIPPGGNQSFAADNRYVRVSLTQPVQAFLAWIFGVTHTTTSAIAIAGPASSAGPCLLTLGQSGAGAFSVAGNATVTASHCGIYINSNHAAALQISGNATLTATPIQIVGGYSANGNVTISPVTTDASASTDPYASLPMPAFGGCTFNNYSKTGNGNVTLSAGTYCGGITLSGDLGVTFSPGVYVLQGGGLSLSGKLSPITGAGVTFYNSGISSSYPYSGLDMSGNLVLNLSAPTTGTYAGMLFMQNPLNTKTANMVGNAGATLAGNFYFPKNNLNLSGNTGTSIPMGAVIAQKVSVSGNTQLNMTNAYGPASGSNRVGLYQ